MYDGHLIMNTFPGSFHSRSIFSLCMLHSLSYFVVSDIVSKLYFAVFGINSLYVGKIWSKVVTD